MSKDVAGWLNYAPTLLKPVKMPRLLAESEVKLRLSRLKGWKREDDFITKTFEFDSFMDGMAFIGRVAKLAEKQQHHPDIHIRYTTIRLSIQTHSAGGITKMDFDLATAIQALIPPPK